MSCAPCTECEECRTLVHRWPGCGVSDVTNPLTVLPYYFAITIPLYEINTLVTPNTIYPVSAGSTVAVHFTKANGATKIVSILTTVDGELTIDGSEDWYSDGFFNAEAGLISMKVYTDLGVQLLLISEVNCEMDTFQCAGCVLIAFTNSSLPLSTVPFEFDCDFVACTYAVGECVPGCFNLIGTIDDVVDVPVYIRTYTEADAYNGIGPYPYSTILPQIGYVRDEGCYTPLDSSVGGVAAGELCGWLIESGIVVSCG